MNIGSYLYLIILFVVFSPGIVFSIPSSSKWGRVFTHGFLFSVVWLFTHKTINQLWSKSVREGNTTIIASTDSVTSYKQSENPPKPAQKQAPKKCYKKGNFCVTTQQAGSKLNYYCLGDTTGCKWGKGCTDDSDCQNYDVNTSAKYIDKGYDCSNVTGYEWQEWTCKNTAPSN